MFTRNFLTALLVGSALTNAAGGFYRRTPTRLGYPLNLD